MEKEITISGKKVQFKCTGGFLIKFKELTGKDPIAAVTNIETSLGHIAKNKDGEISSADLNIDQLMTFYEIIWVLAKTANEEVGSLSEWLDEFNEFPISDILSELLDLIQKAFQSNLTLKTSKKN